MSTEQNSRGLRVSVLPIVKSAGLTTKPIEYRKQTIGMDSAVGYGYGAEFGERSTGYVDIRPFLQNFPPIVDYKRWKDLKGSW